MPMASMKMKEQSDCCAPCEPNPYGYGLTICLKEEQLAALGITTLPKPGTVMQLTCLATVEETEIEEDKEGTEREMRLQITDMEAAQKAPSFDPNRLYPSMQS